MAQVLRQIGARAGERFVLANEAAHLLGDGEQPLLDHLVFGQRRGNARAHREDRERQSECRQDRPHRCSSLIIGRIFSRSTSRVSGPICLKRIVPASPLVEERLKAQFEGGG